MLKSLLISAVFAASVTSWLFFRYLSGDWDDEILRVVSLAQRKHMIPKRLKSVSEQKHIVSFAPRPEYANLLNK